MVRTVGGCERAEVVQRQQFGVADCPCPRPLRRLLDEPSAIVVTCGVYAAAYRAAGLVLQLGAAGRGRAVRARLKCRSTRGGGLRRLFIGVCPFRCLLVIPRRSALF